MKILVLGGTGVISRAIVDQLLVKNEEVTVFNRGNRQVSFIGDVEHISGNRADREEFEAVMKKRNFDVVIDMICFNQADAESDVRAFGENIEQLVICSSAAVYERPHRSLPSTESQEKLTVDPSFAYGFHKAEMERYFSRLFQTENFPVTIIRPSLTFGSGLANIGILRQNFGIVDRIRKGKPLIMFGDGTTPWNFTFAPDLAKGFIGIIKNKRTYGQAYHITNEDLHIWEDLYLEFGKLIGKEPIIRHIPAELLAKAAPNLCTHLYAEKTYASIYDNSKIRQDLPGYKADITLNEGLKGILEWFEKEANTVDPEKDALEDQLVTIYDQWASHMVNLYIK